MAWKELVTQSDGKWEAVEPKTINDRLAQFPDALLPATDNWPHLYIRKAAIPAEYYWVLGGILAFSLVLVGINFRTHYRPDGHFFFLGAGFLLLETKSVTEFALLIGSTWQVNAWVFSVILLMILLANVLVQTMPERFAPPVCYALLGLALLASYFWPVSQWAGSGTSIVAGAYLGLPIFLAALIFARTFRAVSVGSAALASNLIGAVLGGTLEYLSLVTGIRGLALLALAMYVGSYCCWSYQQRTAPAESSSAMS